MIVPSPEPSSLSRRSVPGWTPFLTFAAAHAGLDRDAFVARVRSAHLLLWTPLHGEAADATFTSVLARPDDDTPPSSTRVLRTRAVAGRGTTPSGVVRVEKRPGANPFALMITLGRAPNNDIVVNHPALSKFHAYLRRSGEGWSIDDAGSTNGTRLDGAPVTKPRGLAVRSGARITLGGEVELELLEPADLWARLSGP